MKISQFLTSILHPREAFYDGKCSSIKNTELNFILRFSSQKKYSEQLKEILYSWDGVLGIYIPHA